jgi:serine/threonine-protein kinase
MKCLEREPARRYESARALGEDLQRFLDGEVPMARPRSGVYRILRRARKHKLLVGLATIVLGALVTLFALWIRGRNIAAEEAQLSQQLGENIKEMELFLRYAHALPLHDVVREEDVIRERLAAIEGESTASGDVGRGARQYALGRGYFVLREHRKAYLYFTQASAQGYASPDLEFALGRTLVELYREALEEASRISNTEKRKAQIAELDDLYKIPALKHLQAAGRSRLEHPAYVEGLIAMLEGKHQLALDKAHETLKSAPWFYEAMVLEAQAQFAEGSRYRHDAAFDYEKMMTHFSPAIEAYRRAADMGRSDPAVHEGACELWIQILISDGASGRPARRSFEEARDACSRTITANPKRGSAYVRMAFAHVAYADVENEKATAPRPVIDEAVYHADVAVTKVPDDVFAQWLLGAAWRQRVAYAVNSGLDGRDAADRSIAAYSEALRIDPSFLWAARELALTYVLRADEASILGEDANQSLENARLWLDYADTLSPSDTFHAAMRCDLESVWSRALLDAGGDPTPSVMRSRTVCQAAMVTAPDFVLNYHYHGLSLVASAQYANAVGNDPTPIANDAERVVAAMPRNTPAGLRAQIVGPIRTSAARLLLAHGESPDERLREARELLLQAIQDDPVKVSPRLDLVDVELARIDWAMAQGKMDASQFTRILGIVEPLLNTEFIDPRPFERAAKIHERRARWLASREEDFAEALLQGARMVQQALRRNPHHAAAIAVRGALHLVRARSAKQADERIAAAKRAKESLSIACRANPLIAREYADALKEANWLDDDTDMRAH